MSRVQAEEMELLVAGHADADSVDLLDTHHSKAVTRHNARFTTSMAHLIQRQTAEVLRLANFTVTQARLLPNKNGHTNMLSCDASLGSVPRTVAYAASVPQTPKTELHSSSINGTESSTRVGELDGVRGRGQQQWQRQGSCMSGGVGVRSTTMQVIHTTEVLTRGLVGCRSQRRAQQTRDRSLHQRLVDSIPAATVGNPGSAEHDEFKLGSSSWTNYVPQRLGFAARGGE
jgi:hypothetical protein